MEEKLVLEQFEQIYKDTYPKVLKYIICKCLNTEDVNDIIQEVYTEFYKHLVSMRVIENNEAYLIGIANHKVKKYYTVLKRIPIISLFAKTTHDTILLDNICSEEIIEDVVFSKLMAEKVWEFLKSKGSTTMKVFSLYYQLDITIKEIAEELNLSESKVKNILYRTLKELKENVKKWS